MLADFLIILEFQNGLDTHAQCTRTYMHAPQPIIIFDIFQIFKSYVNILIYKVKFHFFVRQFFFSLLSCRM